MRFAHVCGVVGLLLSGACAPAPRPRVGPIAPPTVAALASASPPPPTPAPAPAPAPVREVSRCTERKVNDVSLEEAALTRQLVFCGVTTSAVPTTLVRPERCFDEDEATRVVDASVMPCAHRTEPRVIVAVDFDGVTGHAARANAYASTATEACCAASAGAQAKVAPFRGHGYVHRRSWEVATASLPPPAPRNGARVAQCRYRAAMDPGVRAAEPLKLPSDERFAAGLRLAVEERCGRSGAAEVTVRFGADGLPVNVDVDGDAVVDACCVAAVTAGAKLQPRSPGLLPRNAFFRVGPGPRSL